jgi:FkbM family methyltransferase
MSRFDTDLIFKIDDKWFWRKDDHNLKTFNGLSSETDLLEVVKPYLKGNRVVIQAGGNCGMQVVKFADHFEMVYTFEPDPVNFHCLVNNLPYNNVIKFQCCLGDDHRMVSMTTLPNEIGGFYVNPNYGTTPTLRIDDLALSHCDQLFALMGAVNTIKKFKPVISVEFDWAFRYNVNVGDIKSFMANLGYEKVETYTTDHIYTYQNLSFSL